MSGTLLTNLEIILARFAGGAARAREVLAEHRDGKIDDAGMKWLLRHHSVAPVRGDETWIRDSFDVLLSMYALVEIACLIRRVPVPLPEEFASEARVQLNDPAVQAYYETHYPLRLPTALRLRLAGKHAITEEMPRAEELFIAFLTLNASIEGDIEVDLLLWMLDDGNAPGDNTTLSDLSNVLATPSRFGEMLSTTPNNEKVTWGTLRLIDAIRGLGKFLTFCVGLEDLLDSARDLPTLRSAMWHYHSYWFGLLRDKVGVDLATAVEQFGEWYPDNVSYEARLQSHDSVSSMSHRLRRLSGDEFREPLEGMVIKLM